MQDPQAAGSASDTTGEQALAFDRRATSRLLRKIDLRLIPLLALLYLLSFLDRTNIGNARLAGLEADLHLRGLDYNNALAIFFPFYVAAELPSNLVMKITRPSLWIPTIMVTWAGMCVLMGLVKSYGGLLAIRSALGFAEGGLFPGVTFYITMWYRRHECGLRIALFFSASTAAGAFGGLLAPAIMQMNGTAHLASWRWIFILEGLATFLIGCLAFFAMNDYPDRANFLTKAEKDEVRRRLQEDSGGLGDEFSFRYVADALADWRIWANCFIALAIFCSTYSISLFLPTIVKHLGYTNTIAQLMTVPPYAAACICCIGFGFTADRHGQRGIYIIICALIAIVGFCMLLGSTDSRIKYAGTFFAASGIYPNVPQCVAWNGNNIGGSTKRSAGMAVQIAIGNLGGVMSAYLFLSKDAPDFKRGHWVLLGLNVLAGLLALAMTVYFRFENARRDRRFKVPGDFTTEEKALEKSKGDQATFFRYTI
ncbi:major facilitator superfamily transporter [Trichodelitschia bisporula]|uniref:Major facilitator superfamily transporter n=1 Tax=Trichodelitschia bisporula TaxID=703511 RepID=A0A6G1IB33_9PEZI|nr:major facilitator superfamily transporter [Trichodelitschia bisporula]